MELNQFEQKLAHRLELPDRDLLLNTFSVDLALKTYGVQNPIRNLWYKDMPMPDSTAYVLFNEDQFKEQWVGKSVMINWEKLNDQGYLTRLSEPMDGWKLYKYIAKRPSHP